jgi:hypothetical protein
MPVPSLAQCPDSRQRVAAIWGEWPGFTLRDLLYENQRQITQALAKHIHFEDPLERSRERHDDTDFDGCLLQGLAIPAPDGLDDEFGYQGPRLRFNLRIGITDDHLESIDEKERSP